MNYAFLQFLCLLFDFRLFGHLGYTVLLILALAFALLARSFFSVLLFADSGISIVPLFLLTRGLSVVFFLLPAGIGLSFFLFLLPAGIGLSLFLFLLLAGIGLSLFFVLLLTRGLSVVFLFLLARSFFF